MIHVYEWQANWDKQTQFLSQKLKQEQMNEFQMLKSPHLLPSISHSDTGGMTTNAPAFSS